MGTRRLSDNGVQRREQSRLPSVSYVAFVVIGGKFVLDSLVTVRETGAWHCRIVRERED